MSRASGANSTPLGRLALGVVSSQPKLTVTTSSLLKPSYMSSSEESTINSMKREYKEDGNSNDSGIYYLNSALRK